MEQFINNNKDLSTLTERNVELEEHHDTEEDLTIEESSSEEGEEDLEAEQENKKGIQESDGSKKDKDSNRELRPRKHKLKNKN